jgi:hypothetical protein
MDGVGDGQDAEQFLMDAINHYSTAVYEQYGEEEAQTADSFLNMSGDGFGEEDDDDFALRHEQPVPSENPIGARILCIYILTETLYKFYISIIFVINISFFSPPDRRVASPNGNDRQTKKMEGRQVVTQVEPEGCPCAPEEAGKRFTS